MNNELLDEIEGALQRTSLQVGTHHSRTESSSGRSHYRSIKVSSPTSGKDSFSFSQMEGLPIGFGKDFGGFDEEVVEVAGMQVAMDCLRKAFPEHADEFLKIESEALDSEEASVEATGSGKSENENSTQPTSGSQDSNEGSQNVVGNISPEIAEDRKYFLRAKKLKVFNKIRSELSSGTLPKFKEMTKLQRMRIMRHMDFKSSVLGRGGDAFFEMVAGFDRISDIDFGEESDGSIEIHFTFKSEQNDEIIMHEEIVGMLEQTRGFVTANSTEVNEDRAEEIRSLLSEAINSAREDDIENVKRVLDELDNIRPQSWDLTSNVRNILDGR